MTNEIKEIINDLQRVADRKCCPEDILDGSIAQEWVDYIENYITNLQEENERLKEENKRIFSKVNDDELLISNAMNYAEAQDYKQRIDKANQLIEKHKRKDGFLNLNEWQTRDLSNILRGDE